VDMSERFLIYRGDDPEILLASCLAADYSEALEWAARVLPCWSPVVVRRDTRNDEGEAEREAARRADDAEAALRLTVSRLKVRGGK
jgi:hypothetical protein